MMSDNTDIKKDGEKILNNYKKQLAEKLAREAAENTNLFSRPNTGSRGSKRSKFGGTATSMKSMKSGKSNKTRERATEEQKLIATKMNEVSTFDGEPIEPAMLMAILGKKSKIQ